MSNTVQKIDYHREHSKIIEGNSLHASAPAVNCAQAGQGQAVLLVHGLAASLHDWDEFLPRLAKAGYAGFALDLLGHGESAKPDELEAYAAEGIFAHMLGWIDSLALTEPFTLIGHSLGGYLTLDYARRFPQKVKALVLVNPFYSVKQLPSALQLVFRRPLLNTALIQMTPYWLFRALIDLSSLTFGSPSKVKHSLPEAVRIQTAIDYKRSSPNIYNIPRTLRDLTPDLPSIQTPTLVIWGKNDQTLNPASFPQLVEALPNATGMPLPDGHVPHQSNADEFNRLVLDFLSRQ